MPVNDTRDYISISIAGAAPVSRGNVTINSTDVNDHPLISPNWLLSPTDQEVAIAGLKVARDIAQLSGLADEAEYFPGSHVQSDADILQAIKETLAPIHHAVGTCELQRPTPLVSPRYKPD